MSHHLGMLARIGAIVSFTLMSGLHVYGQRPVTDSRNASPFRQNAIFLLDSTIDELRDVEDVEARVTFAADIVRLLGSVKPERCRQMLDSIFDDLMKLKNAKSSQSNSQRPSPDALLQKLIKAAASFDRKLARNYINRYTEEAPAQKSEPATPAQSLSQQADLNMLLALQLIETQPALAVRVAQNAVAAAVTVRTLEFLGTLRKKDAGLANAFFATALQSVIARRGTDINELLLLYTYVFSPRRVLGVTSQGIVLRQIPGYQRVAQDYPVDSRLAQQFLQASAQILLADPQYRQGNLSSGTGAAGDLYLINLIKPQVAIYASRLLGPLSEQAGLLVSYLQSEQYSRLQSDVERLGRVQNGTGEGAANGASDVESLLSRAAALPPSAKRDYLYYTAAVTAVREKHYDAALDIVEHVSEEFRAKVKEFIGFSIAQQSVSDRQFERAEQWAERDADLTRRAYLFALIASALLDDDSKDYTGATRLLNEVERLASKLDAKRERISVLLRAAEIFSRFDIPRASEVLRLAFKAANGSEGFTGDSKVTRLLEVGDFGFFYEMFNDNLSLSRTLSPLAFSDFYGMVSTVRDLQNRAFRLRAVISLCGGVLTGERPNRPRESRTVSRGVL
ncbi:MAG: hypothetical protein AABN95_19470 [Acidobacteriota bacterium]